MDTVDKSAKVTVVEVAKRREYGTPIDSSNITQVPCDQTFKFNFDIEPSCSFNSSKYGPSNQSTNSNNGEKKKSNRRKKRAKQINQKNDIKSNDQLENSTETDVLYQLTQNLKHMLMSKIPQETTNNTSQPEKNTNSSSKDTVSTKVKRTKVITNSKYKSPDSQKTPKKESKRVSQYSNNKIRTPKQNQLAQKEESIQFLEYLTQEQVEEGLKSGELIKGYIRVNPKDYKAAYIANPNKTENDIMFEGLQDRNRALDGDLVAVRLHKETDWRSPQHKTGVVVRIIEKVHPRTCVGILRLAPDNNAQWAVFHPRDGRIPRLRIPFTDWPPLFRDNADKYREALYVARVEEWPANSKNANGRLLDSIGMCGDIRAETQAILRENCLNVQPYGKEIKPYLPSSLVVTPEEVAKRLDLRKQCIFTIDPATARDLDDAVSCRELENGELEIGVHISDVSHWLKEGTPLDSLVAERATSTYMVESVYHMLPSELCAGCSLLPGEDRLAFSVIWTFKDGKFGEPRFERTVINSCAQLAYEHAQAIIENTDTKLPVIHHGFTSEDIITVVKRLYEITRKMREERFNGGALRIDQPKMCFELKPVTCEPISFRIYEQRESHRLIEELMLLANMAVAEKLQNEYPSIALLRAHPSPNELLVGRLKTMLERVGVLLDVSTAGALQRSLAIYMGDDDEICFARSLVLSHLCAKTMTRAHYLCANNEEDDYYRHYALNVPLYTHFTSPIRRFADVTVHRLLAGVLDGPAGTVRPVWTTDYVQELAANCNKQKYNAKRAGEQSLELYYIHYIGQLGALDVRGVVCEVRDTSFDVVVLDSGVVCKVYLNTLPKLVKYKIIGENGEEIEVRNNKKKEQQNDEDNKKEFTGEKKIKTLVVSWCNKVPPVDQVISLFSVVNIRLKRQGKLLKLEAQLLCSK